MGQLVDRIQHLLFEDKPEWVGPKVLKFLADNPTFFLTLAYLCASALGLLFEFFLFLAYGVNILDYSDAADFLLSAVKRPQPALFSIAVIVILVYYRALSKYACKVKRHWVRIFLLLFVWVGLLRREMLIVIGFLVLFVIYYTSANFKAHEKIFTEDTIVTITTRFGEPKEYKLISIGATERFLFGIQYTAEIRAAREANDFEPVKVLVRAVPFSNVTRIDYSEVSVSRRRWQLEPTGGLLRNVLDRSKI